MASKAAIATVICVMFLAGSSVSYPLHASCDVQWRFGISCADVMAKIVAQINAWQGSSGCAQGGEKCLYSLQSSSSSSIAAKHETPVRHYIDDLTFTADSPTADSCAVHGHSASKVWYSIMDYGTNYCNLANLITGSGLDRVSGYSETTSNKVCTQFTSADCTLY
ncbi:hypothetical protein ScPMuIL_016690 [Solemya velum]